MVTVNAQLFNRSDTITAHLDIDDQTSKDPLHYVGGEGIKSSVKMYTINHTAH